MLRHACRSLAAAPLLSAVVIGSLAAGIGANTVVFSWLQTVLWKPLPGVSAAAGLETIEARVAWNEIRPQVTRRHPLPYVVGDRRYLYFAGTATNLRPGDGVSTEDAGTLTLTAKEPVEALLFDLGPAPARR